MRLGLLPGRNVQHVQHVQDESFEAALEFTFPERELTEAEKLVELNRLFQSTAITPENPISDADVPF